MGPDPQPWTLFGEVHEDSDQGHTCLGTCDQRVRGASSRRQSQRLLGRSAQDPAGPPGGGLRRLQNQAGGVPGTSGHQLAVCWPSCPGPVCPGTPRTPGSQHLQSHRPGGKKIRPPLCHGRPVHGKSGLLPQTPPQRGPLPFTPSGPSCWCGSRDQCRPLAAPRPLGVCSRDTDAHGPCNKGEPVGRARAWEAAWRPACRPQGPKAGGDRRSWRAASCSPARAQGGGGLDHDTPVARETRWPSAKEVPTQNVPGAQPPTRCGGEDASALSTQRNRGEACGAQSGLSQAHRPQASMAPSVSSVDTPQHFHSGRQTWPLKRWVWTIHGPRLHGAGTATGYFTKKSEPTARSVSADPLRAFPAEQAQVQEDTRGPAGDTHEARPLALGLQVSETRGCPGSRAACPAPCGSREPGAAPCSRAGRAPQRQDPSV